MAGTNTDPAPSFGALLQQWRRQRSLSQLALASEAEVSARHVCFIETGRARPSRAMVLQLAEVLRVPLRDRNHLLLAAGFAPAFRESALDSASLSAVTEAMQAILEKQEPFPAVAMNRRWDIVTHNRAAGDLFARLLDGRQVPGPANVLRLMFHPEGVRRAVEQWEAVAAALIARVHREATEGVLDAEGRALLDEILAYPGVPPRLTPAEFTPLSPVLPIGFTLGGRSLRFFSAVTVIGTPQDVTAQELRIESFFPSDEATKQAMQP
jgi:transcriptional regulator with XRE-family HTH domain